MEEIKPELNHILQTMRNLIMSMEQSITASQESGRKFKQQFFARYTEAEIQQARRTKFQMQQFQKTSPDPSQQLQVQKQQELHIRNPNQEQQKCPDSTRNSDWEAEIIDQKQWIRNSNSKIQKDRDLNRAFVDRRGRAGSSSGSDPALNGTDPLAAIKNKAEAATCDAGGAMASGDPMTADNDVSAAVLEATQPSSGHQTWHRDMAVPLAAGSGSGSGVHHAGSSQSSPLLAVVVPHVKKIDVAAGDVSRRGESPGEAPRSGQVPMPTFPDVVTATAALASWLLHGEPPLLEKNCGHREEPSMFCADVMVAAYRGGNVVFSVTGHGSPVTEKSSGGIAGGDGEKQRERLAIDFIGWGAVEAAMAATLRRKGSSRKAAQQVGMQEWGVSSTLVLVGQALATRETLVGCGHVLKILGSVQIEEKLRKFYFVLFMDFDQNFVSPITLWDPSGTSFF